MLVLIFFLGSLAAFVGSVPHEKLKILLEHNFEDAPNSRLFEQTINSTFECIRSSLENGIPELNVPAYPEILVDGHSVDLLGLGLPDASGYFNITNVVVKGYTGFVATSLRGSLSVIPLGYRIEGVLLVPSLSINLEYDGDLITTGMAIYGKGTISMELTGITLDIRTFLGIVGGLRLRDLTLFIHIDAANTQFTGWLHSDDQSKAVSDLVNDFFIPAWINKQPNELNEVLSPILLNTLNDALSGPGNDNEPGEENIMSAILDHCISIG